MLINAHRLKTNVCCLLTGLLMLCPAWLEAQTPLDTIVANFSIREKIPYEKLYLHLDKPYYSAGEKIWFKGYLVNAATHQDNSQSNFIVAELINQADSVVERKKIKRDSTGFHNAFTLPATLPAGHYYLRAYSNWMLNEEPDYFFSRNLPIGNAIDQTIQAHASYRCIDSIRYEADIRFCNNVQEPFAATKIRFRYFENGRLMEKGTRVTDEQGHLCIDLPDLKTAGQRLIEVEFDDPQYVFRKKIFLPSFQKDFNVAFFPEGGALLTLKHQNVAFKALNSDGFAEEIRGVVCNASGDTLSSFHSEHDGMGVFSLNNIQAEPYYVLVQAETGQTKRFDLPEVATQGFSLSMLRHRRNIRFQIQKTEATTWPEQLYLLAHTRNKLVICQPIPMHQPTGTIPDSLFQEGITHFLLVNEAGHPLSERLLFIPDQAPIDWDIQTDQPQYGKREKVCLSVQARQADGTPVEGCFSISVTDRQFIQPDSLADHIASNLLLTSDLKGHIENPGFYFLRQDNKTLRALDFVMMTHGWKKHHITPLTRPPFLDFKHYIERGQTISGRIKGLFGKGIKKGPIYALAPKANILATTLTDDNGAFLLQTDFKDSTAFVIQARTKNGFAGVDIILDRTPEPAPFRKHPFPARMPLAMEHFLTNSRDQYYLDGGMRVYNLKEVLVTAKKDRPAPRSIYASGINTFTVEGERLSRYAARSAYDVALRLPGVTAKNGNELYIRNSEQQALVVIDDVVYEDDCSFLQDIEVDHMASISLVRGTDAVILGPRAAGGAIVISLKDPKFLPSKPARGIVTYHPLGYCDAVEFYAPTYETPEKRKNPRADLRSTLYWNPSFRLDAEGKATLEYYTSDSEAVHDIVIEGVDKNGKITRVVKSCCKKQGTGNRANN